MNAQVFFRTFNRVPERGVVQVVDVQVEEQAELRSIIEVAGRACGKALLARSGLVGVFEVQTDAGIWDTAHGGCLLTKAVRFRTWDELDCEEGLTAVEPRSESHEAAPSQRSSTMAKASKKTTTTKSPKAPKSGKSEAQLAVLSLENAGWSRAQIAREVGTTFQSIRYYAMGGSTGRAKLATLTSLLGKAPPTEKAETKAKAAKGKRAAPAKEEEPAKPATRSTPAVSKKEQEEVAEREAEAAHKAAGKKGRIIDVPGSVATGSLKAPSTVAASPRSSSAVFLDHRQLTLPLDVLLSNGQLPPAMENALRKANSAGARVQVELVSVTVPFAETK